MPDSSTRLALPLLKPAQAQKHVTHNEALARLDLLVQAVLEEAGLAAPPVSPAEGEAWGIGPAATGDWAGQDGRIAAWQEGGWMFLDPTEGWLVWDRAAGALRVRQGGAWADPVAGANLTQLDGVGIGTDWDAVNRLAVAAEATLLSHAGAGHQLKINKSGAAQTASLLYQSDWSGRAEIGLAGTNDLSVKVSADGSAWTTGFSIARTSGRVSLPQGATVTGTLTGTAVIQSDTDGTAGRLMTTGAFGLGTPTGQNPPAATLANGIVPGLYAYYSSDPQAPTGNSGAVLVQRYAANWAIQWARPLGGFLSFSRYSTNAGTSWSAWRRDYGQGTVLGAVSQSGGVPTGALIERGSNANGDYVRLADGTQICTRTTLSAANVSTADGALFRSGDVTWTYPAAFAVAPAVSGGPAADADCWVSARNATTTAVTARLRSTVTKASTSGFGLTATGRWF